MTFTLTLTVSLPTLAAAQSPLSPLSRMASTVGAGRSGHRGHGRGRPTLRAFRQQQRQLVLRDELAEQAAADPAPAGRSRSLGARPHGEGSGRIRSFGHHCSYREIRQAMYPGRHPSSSSSSSSSSDEEEEEEEEEEDRDLEIACQLSRADFEREDAKRRQGEADLEAAVLLSEASTQVERAEEAVYQSDLRAAIALSLVHGEGKAPPGEAGASSVAGGDAKRARLA